jgi:hypothetical protein
VQKLRKHYLKTAKDKSHELNKIIVGNIKGFVGKLRKLGDSTLNLLLMKKFEST